jgi:8-oxo-dGTP diphosphatase
MRIRSAAVILESGRLLVIERFRDGRNYCVLPGGGVEPGEGLREACRREVREETGLDGEVADLLDVPIDSDTPAVYFMVRVAPASLVLGGPEVARVSERNRYEPKWVAVESLSHIPLVPHEAMQAIKLALEMR